MITITTPTGNIGRRLIERLAFAGKPLTIVARHPEKLPRSLREREIVRQASSDDAAALSRATEGTDVLFWLTPANFAAPNVPSLVPKGCRRRLPGGKNQSHSPDREPLEHRGELGRWARANLWFARCRTRLE